MLENIHNFNRAASKLGAQRPLCVIPAASEQELWDHMGYLQKSLDFTIIYPLPSGIF